jgi:diacylglycerol kinase family enzyme
MLARKDKVKLPIAMIPNGSGNDTCSAIGILTLDHALDYIVSGEVVALDTVRCLVDHDTYEEIADTELAQ